MTNSRHDLAGLPELRDLLRVERAWSKVKHWSESADVEDTIEVLCFDVGELFSVGEEVLYFLVIQEIRVVIWVCLSRGVEYHCLNVN